MTPSFNKTTPGLERIIVLRVVSSIIAKGYSGAGLTDGASTAATVAGDWKGAGYLQIKQDAYTRLINFYNELSK